MLAQRCGDAVTPALHHGGRRLRAKRGSAWGALEGLPIDRDQPEGRFPVPPFVVVQCCPVHVPADVDTVCHRGEQAAECSGGVLDALGIVCDRDPVLRHEDRNTAGDVPGVPNRHSHRVRMVGRSDEGVVRMRGVRHESVIVHLLTGVGLHADEVVAAGRLKVEVLWAESEVRSASRNDPTPPEAGRDGSNTSCIPAVDENGARNQANAPVKTPDQKQLM